MAPQSTAERALYFFGRPLVRCFYRVTALGLENLPARGFLLVPNHISWVDALVLQLACPRPIRYVIDQEYYHKRILHPILRVLGCIPISKKHSHTAVRAAAERISAGEIVCVFPEGELERRGTLLRLQRGYEVIARHARAQVVPVWLDQLWGSIFSFQGGRFFTKFPKRIPYPVTIAFGKPLKADAADTATLREELLKLGEFCFSRRPSLDRHLAEESVRGLKRRRFATAVIDGTDHSELSRAKLLGAATALSRYLRKEFSDERIAIVLPASKGSMLANLAVTLANKVPVDLNFTMGRAANESCYRRANLRVAISATPFMERLKDFPWPEHILKLDELVPCMKRQIILWWIISLLAPAPYLRLSLRKAEPEQLRSLRLIIAGAEKLPLDLASHFEKRFHKKVFEGYGLTETAPVVSTNLPDPEPKKPGEHVQPSSRLGSVGRLAPGVAPEIREPETDRKLSLFDSGMLWLRGPNIFEGYLHDPQRTD